MLQKHAGVVALGLLIGGFLGHLVYESLNLAPAVMISANATSQELSPGVTLNANPHPDCKTATWPDIPKRCLTRSNAKGAG